MGKFRIAASVLAGLCFFAPGIFSQETGETIPEALRRPERGEAPRYPEDMVIGDLGQGKAPEEAYRFARDILDALITGSRNAPVLADSLSVLTENLFEELLSIEPRNYHLGGGNPEADGSVSFLVRFLGAGESITGELYLRREDRAKPVPAEIAAPDAENGETPAIPASPEAAGSSAVQEAAGEPVSAADAAAIEAPQGTGSPGGHWFLDDLILEEKKANTDIKDSYRYDFSPYERFY